VTKWDRARSRTACGGCPNRIAAGEPFRRLQQGTFVFCAVCALRVYGETVPEDLPEPEPPRPAARPLQPFVDRMRRQLGLDFKKAQSGGEE